MQRTSRSTLRRRKERGRYDRSAIDSILDEGLVCHVGFTDSGSLYVIPMTYARIGDLLYLHGAAGNHLLRSLAEGGQACVEVTLLDGLVLARSAFHHSMNYRSVILFGSPQRVTDPEEMRRAASALLEHMAPGRSADARPPNDIELSTTLMVRFHISEGSAKVRSGPPLDDDEDLGLPIWAGQIPLEMTAQPAIPAAGLPEQANLPTYARSYPDRHRTI